MASNRTLSYTGEKTTYLSVKSVNSTTHSYTLMPIISAAGRLLSPVFICLQEPTGRFPITKTMFSAPNVVTSCSKSGKLSTSLIEYWIREVLDKVTSNRFLLFVDQWSPQADISVYENNLTKGQSCKLLVIPRRTTSTRQPCDTYFFRQWKELTRRIYHRVSLDELNIDLRSRDAIIKLQSLVHNQLSSSIFKPMISHAWSTCGYIPKQHPNFSNVIEVCFSFEETYCSNRNCDESAFICCSHYRQILCFEHFFVVYHFH
jgi:Tc5 transposase C-terminal domain/DDE superfamily endonuclease